MITYFAIGIGTWLGASVCRQDTFQQATSFQIFKGLLFSVLCWPVMLIILYYDVKEEQ